MIDQSLGAIPRPLDLKPRHLSYVAVAASVAAYVSIVERDQLGVVLFGVLTLGLGLRWHLLRGSSVD